MDIFSVPVGEKILIYAPRHELAALVNRQAAAQICQALETGSGSLSGAAGALVERLCDPGKPAPQARLGPLEDPFFLGLIPTRGCNLGCRYCNFGASQDGNPVMSLTTARSAIDAYFEILQQAGKGSAAIHFFGGEPFYAPHCVHFAVGYARLRAEQLGLRLHLEATTNGFYSENECQWIAGAFDTIVLSIDGTPEIQDRQRPAVKGRGSSQVVARSARIFSEGQVELILRACVTSETAGQMDEIAAWFADQFRPSTVCFEALTPSPLSQSAGLLPPDPVAFAAGFLRAARRLEARGIQAVNSTGDPDELRASFCPVGNDALIVSPDGSVDACYLLAEEWLRKGLDLHLGRLVGHGFEIDAKALQRVRRLTVHTRTRCAGCLCRYHCAGGCHVKRAEDAPAGEYDRACVQTRLITIGRLLERLGHQAEVDAWLANPAAWETSIWQKNDRMLPLERAWG